MKIPELLHKNRLIISLNIAGLLLYIFSPLFFGLILPGRPDSMHVPLIANNGLIATFFYLNLLLLMPYVLKRRGWIPYLVVGLICMLALVVISFYMRELLFEREFLPPPFEG